MGKSEKESFNKKISNQLSTINKLEAYKQQSEKTVIEVEELQMEVKSKNAKLKKWESSKHGVLEKRVTEFQKVNKNQEKMIDELLDERIERLKVFDGKKDGVDQNNNVLE